jgi:hypothetical protein
VGGGSGIHRAAYKVGADESETGDEGFGYAAAGGGRRGFGDAAAVGGRRGGLAEGFWCGPVGAGGKELVRTCGLADGQPAPLDGTSRSV